MSTRKNAVALSNPKRMLFAGGALGMFMLAAGCVPQDKYDDLLTSYRTLKEENVQLKDDIDALSSTNTMYQNRIGASGSQLSQLESENNRLRGEVDQLESEYQQLLSRLDSMDLGPLPDDVDMALERLAAKHPSLLTYDSRIGMVRFASDLTFALGSATLTDDARASLAEFAEITNAASVAGYELRLVGHTDTVPIRNAATIAKHPTNLHLSVHRAIAVAEELESNGVAANRMQAAGYGPHRPIVANGPGGAEQNRRVEIFLVPMRNQPLENLPAASGTGNTGSTATVIDEPMK